jgi:hypothetical protein
LIWVLSPVSTPTRIQFPELGLCAFGACTTIHLSVDFKRLWMSCDSETLGSRALTHPAVKHTAKRQVPETEFFASHGIFATLTLIYRCHSWPGKVGLPTTAVPKPSASKLPLRVSLVPSMHTAWHPEALCLMHC